MKKLRWQILVVILALIAIGALLFLQKPELTPGRETVIEPVTGGIYSEGLIGSLGRLNPVLDYYNQVDHDIDRLIYSSLIRFDDRGLPYGDLAESWGISLDAEIYNFSIRSNAIWHDGEPVTSEDVLFTIELLRSQDLPIPVDIREFWEQIDATALDEKTIQFILPEPFSPFLDYLTFGVLPAHLLEDLEPEEIIDAPFNLQPVGSGPYRFQGFIVEDDAIVGVELAAFEDYYRQSPFIEDVVFRYYNDSGAALFAYKEGEITGIGQVNLDVLDDVLNEADLNLFSARLPRFALVYLNLDRSDKPFFQDLEVRRALLMAINRRWILDRILDGQAFMAHAPIFPENWAYYQGIEQIPFDREGALEILKDAGYTIPAEGGSVRAKDGAFLSFELVHPDQEPYRQIAEQIQSDWAKIGVQANLVPVSYDELLEDYLEPRDYDAALVELDFSRSPDPDPYPFWHQTQVASGQNYAGWDDRQASEYLERARVVVELDERTRLYHNFLVRFSEELPALPLFYPVYSYAVDSQIQGVSVGPFYDPSDRFRTVTAWYLISRVASADQATESAEAQAAP